METSETLRKAGVRLLWFDSMGAKSASIAVETSAGTVVIDPGASRMHPTYPLPQERKLELRSKAVETVEEAAVEAVAIFVTHYHKDHYLRPGDRDLRHGGRMWVGRRLIVKNPNIYINESQWARAREFLSEVLKLHGESLDDHLTGPIGDDFPDPVDGLEAATSRNFGAYQRRRMELLERGRRWFTKLVDLWSRRSWIEEVEVDGTKITWGDGRRFEFGDTVFEVLEPWFHGIEYDRTGWVTPILIRRRGWRIVYTSDVMGPQIEDYAYTLADLKPDVMVLDGPPTYLFPYMLNRVNLQRAIENAITILQSDPKLVVYDHHLLRERRWRNMVARVFTEAEKRGVALATAAECLGTKPLIDLL